MLVSGHLSTWARLWAAVGAIECGSVATSIYFRPTPIIQFLPGTDPIWAVAFFALGGGFLGLATLFRARRRFGIFSFSLAGTAHATYGVGALGYSVFEHTSWVLTSTMFGLAALNFLAAWKIAGVRH